MSEMSAAEFLGLGEPSGGGVRSLPITSRAVGGGRGSLFGGVGLAAGIVALEEETGMPAVWATGQYASTVFAPATMELAVELPAVGRTVTQGRVIGRSDGAEIITILGAVGRRPEVVRSLLERCPAAPPPQDCADVERSFDYASIHDHVEVRIARGMFGFTGVGEPTDDHHTLLWVRMPEVRHDAAALAIMADYSPSALGNAVGRVTHLTSLDNTIRFADHTDHEGEWILCDNHIDFVGNGFAHGSCRMWSQRGVLLATASQSMTVVVPTEHCSTG